MRDNATQNQVDASDPHLNTWLSANAGSGKTKVLTDRVARLLLNGVEPQNILCLTYTKAAASEMQNRLFSRLGAWAMLENKELQADLIELGESRESVTQSIEGARKLFARAIETPGGLKIQTIHSFCASILRKFPLEAGISPQFKELDEAGVEKIVGDIFESVAAGQHADALRGLASNHALTDIQSLLSAIVKKRKAFLKPLDQESLRKKLSLDNAASKDALLKQAFSAHNQHILTSLMRVLKNGSTNDQKAFAKLRLIKMSGPTLLDLKILEDLFLTGAKPAKTEPYSAKIGAFPTKSSQALLADVMPNLNELMLSIESKRETRLSLLTFERTRDFHNFAHQFVLAYEQQKLLLGVLDFDDLIEKTKSLLEDQSVAQWILYRLDGGIDHLLVDEAQDTSPEQWAIVRALTDEFASGEGRSRSELPRTIFVVGDKKQSIYSFQGADPKAFDRLQEHFQKSLSDAKNHLQEPSLQHSFRSSSAILRLVDETFVRERAESIGSKGQHISFKSDMPGRVDLWEPIETSQEVPNETKWFEPVDQVGSSHHEVVLANRIAAQIEHMIDHERLPIEPNGSKKFARRKITEGDFLILVQRRSGLFSEIIRACKSKGLKVAGADRLQLKAELAVKDIIAVLRFLALPEDSLSLASALKSPLFSWSEQDLFSLANAREEKHLWAALRNSSQHAKTVEILNDLRLQSDFLRPFELIDRLLLRHNGRKNLVARLGEEAIDGINAVLAQSLAYERTGIPSLDGFLIWFDTYAAEVKRQTENQSDQIRIMTVHGSKGLESPIVILPDTAIRQNTSRDALIDIDGTMVWKPSTQDLPKPVSLAHEKLAKKQADERLRLLYVAMTRAEKWLIVAAAGKVGSGNDSWYSIVSDGFEHVGADTIEQNEFSLKRYSHGNWDHGSEVETRAAISTPHEKIELSHVKTPDVVVPLNPSQLGGSKVIVGTSEDGGGIERGNLVHKLLEELPKYPNSKWPKIGTNILAQFELEDDAATQVLEEIIKLLTIQDLNWIFAPDTLAEVEISATIAELNNLKMHGVIDRLIVTETTVHIVDFKTNEVVPSTPEETPDGILRQLGLYASAIKSIYPKHQVFAAILWTETQKLMVLPDALISGALARVNQP